MFAVLSVRATKPLWCAVIATTLTASAAAQARAGGSTASVGSLSGQADLHVPEGGSHHCSASEVDLVPATEQASAWIAQAFSSQEQGYLDRIGLEQALKQRPAGLNIRQTVCDRAGMFNFAGVEPGNYYVIARVYWSQRWMWLGGGLMQKASVAANQDVRIRLEK